FLLLLSSPLSPLFPYPTLFRSLRLRRRPRRRRCRSGSPWPTGLFDRRQSSCLLWFARVLGPSSAEATPCSVWSAGLGVASAEEGDRKSTRLNSSHVSISSAVFC